MVQVDLNSKDQSVLQFSIDTAAEYHCTEYKLAELIQSSEDFRHKFGIIAVNFDHYLLKNAIQRRKNRENLNPKCDRPLEFVANTEKIG